LRYNGNVQALLVYFLGGGGKVQFGYKFCCTLLKLVQEMINITFFIPWYSRIFSFLGNAATLKKILTHCRPAMPFGNRNNITEDLSSVLSEFKKYHLPGNLNI